MDGMEISITLTKSYSMLLVILSYVVAVFASFTALHLAGEVTMSEGKGRTIWLLGGAFAMGVGIWAMHFIAALAFMLPVAVTYDVTMTAVSIVPAVIASWIALFVVSRSSMGIVPLIGGALLMGPGIAAMHYTGVSAMRMDATISYDPALFALSVVVAIVVSLVALWLAFHLRSETGGMGALQKGASALVMGAAVVGMHFTGQAATNFTPTDPSVVAASPFAASGNSWLAVSIGVVAMMILGAIFVSSMMQGRSQSPASKHAEPLHSS